MVKLEQVVGALEGEVLYRAKNFDQSEVSFVVACDLMSDVLVVDVENILLVTSLVSRQSLKTAHLVGASGVVIVNDKTLPDDLVALAEELELSVIRSPRDKFRCCVELGKLLGL